MRWMPVAALSILAVCLPAASAAPESGKEPSLAEAVAALDGNPVAARDLVARRLAFRPYAGFLKGPEGAWADRTANAADAAWLLVDILRRQGFEARFAFATLPEDAVTALLRSALPAKPAAAEIAGAIPGEETADPCEDPALRETVAGHVFVQVKIDEDWIDLDPFVVRPKGDAAPVVAERTEDDVPLDALRCLRIEVGARSGADGEPIPALSFESPVAGLFGKTIALVCIGVDEGDRGTRASPARLRPALWIDGELRLGEPFGGPASGPGTADPGGRLGGIFGGGEDGGAPAETAPPALTEVFVDLTLCGGGGPEQRERRYLYLAGPDALDRLDDLTAFAVAFDGPAPGAARSQAATAAAGGKPADGPLLPASGELSGAQKKEAEALFARAASFTGSLAAFLAEATGRLGERLSGAFGTLSMAGDARVVGVSLDGRRNRLSTDLLFDSLLVLARPGTKTGARAAVLGARGILSAELEGRLVAAGLGKAGTGEAPLTVRSVFAAARVAGVKAAILAAENSDLIDGLPFPARTRRILGERVAADRVVLVPMKPVTIDGRPVVAWMEADRLTGEWRGVFEDGRHQAIAEGEAVSGLEGAFAGFGFAFIGGFSGTLWSFASNVLALVDDSDTSFQLIAAQAIDSAAQVDWNSVLLEAWGDTEGLILLGGGPEALVIGQMGMFAGQATAIHFLRSQFPR